MRKYFSFILIGVLVITAGLASLSCTKKPETKYIAFYSLPAETIQAVQTVLKDRFPTIEESFEWRIIDPELPVTSFMEQNPQTVFVFSSDNRGLFEARESFIRHPAETFQPLPSTFLHHFFTQEDDSASYAFPLLLDPVKLACSTAVAEKLNRGSYMLYEDFERIQHATGSNVSFPLACAGGIDEQLFAMISSVASMQGLLLNADTATALGKNPDLHTSCPPVLKTVLDTLVAWRQQGILHPEWFRLVEGDVAIFMEFNSTALAALPLSASRRLKREVLEHFTTMQLPLPDMLVKKNMPATTVVWAQAIQTEEEKFPIIGEIRSFLYAQETDELLARAAHLAPVFAAAQTEDAEASSGRYWAASSNMVIPFLGDAACVTAAEKKQLAESIRRYLEVNGVGY
ncbi:MAG: hypothetical protein ACTTJ4_00525 [Treponema sp.]|uniref:hypothetical protein n=1 Tax=Treponema sp. TaxID=166 RepID=UPI003FA29354